MRFLGGGVGHAKASHPQPNSTHDARDADDMDWADDRNVGDIANGDIEIEDGVADDAMEEDDESDGNQTDGSDTDSDKDEGTDVEGENDSEDEGFAKY
jgi:hypothetical protein